jgi:hypothetical protein
MQSDVMSGPDSVGLQEIRDENFTALASESDRCVEERRGDPVGVRGEEDNRMSRDLRRREHHPLCLPGRRRPRLEDDPLAPVNRSGRPRLLVGLDPSFVEEVENTKFEPFLFEDHDRLA